MIPVDGLRRMLRLNSDGSLTWLSPSKYHADLIGKPAGAPMRSMVGKVYWAVQIEGKKVRRSRINFALTNGRWPSDQIDHIDGNSLNDLPSNLREATPTQNAWNHKGRAKRSPLPMGVRLAVSGRYVARIAVNKKKICLGTFVSVYEAEAAYRAARQKHFGEFA